MQKGTNGRGKMKNSPESDADGRDAFLDIELGHSLFLKWRNENTREEFQILKLTITFDVQ